MTAPSHDPVSPARRIEDEPAGLVLAGGEGRRIGGDKGWRTLNGLPLVVHMLTRLSPQCSACAVSVGPIAWDVATRARLAAALPGHRIASIVDRDGAAGPVAGIAAGLDWLGSTTVPHDGSLLLAPVDMPFLPTDLARRLGPVSADRPMAVARSPSGVSPVVARIHGSARRALAAVLAETPAPPVRRVAEVLDARIVDIAPSQDGTASGADPLFNINTADDLATAEAALASGKTGEPG